MFNYANFFSLILATLSLSQQLNAGMTQNEVIKRARGIYSKHNSDSVSREEISKLANSVNAANYVANPENFTQNPEDLDGFLNSLVRIAENIKVSESSKFNNKLNDIEKQLRKMSKTNAENPAEEDGE